MRTLSVNTKSPRPLIALITATTKLWRAYHLSYDQARYVTKEVRKRLGVQRVTVRKRVIRRLSQDEEQRLIQAAYRHEGERGLLPRAHRAEGRAPEHRSREAQRAACRSAAGRRSRQSLAAASAESEGP